MGLRKKVRSQLFPGIRHSSIKASPRDSTTARGHRYDRKRSGVLGCCLEGRVFQNSNKVVQKHELRIDGAADHRVVDHHQEGHDEKHRNTQKAGPHKGHAVQHVRTRSLLTSQARRAFWPRPDEDVFPFLHGSAYLCSLTYSVTRSWICLAVSSTVLSPLK